MPDTTPILAPHEKLAHHHRKVTAILIAFVILAVGIGAYYFFVFKRSPAESTSVYASISILPASQLYKLGLDNGMLTPVTVSGVQKGAIVIDEAQDASTTYYLITDKTQTSSNIYASTKGAAVTQLTFTPTFKYDLSYDPSTHYFTYVSGSAQTPEQLWNGNANSQFSVMLAALGSNGKIATQTVVTTGASAAAIVPKTNIAIINKSNALYAYSLFGGQSLKIASTASTTVLGKTSDGEFILPNPNVSKIPFAVSSAGMVAVINPVSQAIDIYNASKGLNGFTYVSSQKVPFTPTAIGFEGNQLILGQDAVGTSKPSSIFFIPGVTGLLPFTNPDSTQQFAVPQHIIYE